MSGADLASAVQSAYPAPARATLRRLGKLIDQGEAGVRTHEPEAKQQARLDEFVKLMPKLAAAAAVGEEDRGEAAVVTPPPDRGARNSYVLLSDTMGGLPRGSPPMVSESRTYELRAPRSGGGVTTAASPRSSSPTAAAAASFGISFTNSSRRACCFASGSCVRTPASPWSISFPSRRSVARAGAG